MPGVCGLTATNSIRRIAQERAGPRVYVCMVTADIEGLHTEMDRRHISYEGTVSNGAIVKNSVDDHATASESEKEIASEMSCWKKGIGCIYRR
mgnify:CR=1 FL=1